MIEPAEGGERKYRTLAANTVLLSLGTVGSKLLVFLMVRFYTGYMSPAEYGTADIISQTANLLIPLASFGMAESVFRFTAISPEDGRAAFTAGIVCALAGTAALAALLLPLRQTEFIGQYGRLLAIYIAASCLHSMCAQYVRALGDMRVFALQGLINTALVIGFNIVMLAALRLGVTGYVLSVAAADVCCSLWLIFRKRLWRELTPKLPLPLFRRMLAYGIPLIPTAVFWWITGVSDRYMISAFLGSAANGIYSVSGKIPAMLTVLSTVFIESWQFSAVTQAAEDPKELERFYTRIWSLFQAGTAICAGAMIALSRVGIRLLAEEEYFSAWQYVPALTLATACSALSGFIGSVYTVTGDSKAAFRTAMAGAALNIALNLILIPSPMGVQGAAAATLISCLAVFAIRAANIRRFIAFELAPLRCGANMLILSAQAVFMTMGFPMRGWAQAAAAAAIIAVNHTSLIQCAGRLRGYMRPAGKHLKTNRR